MSIAATAAAVFAEAYDDVGAAAASLLENLNMSNACNFQHNGIAGGDMLGTCFTLSVDVQL